MDTDLMGDIDDLLADTDDPPKKKPSKPVFRPPAQRSPAKLKPSKIDSDFFTGIAATAEDSLSDVSEADPQEMVKQMEGLDDMDAHLFGKKASPRESKKTQKEKVRTKTTDFNDDITDLSDDGDKKPKKISLKKALGTTDTSTVFSEQTPSETVDSNRWLDIERPPTRSGTRASPSEHAETKKPETRKGKREESLFGLDDDDILGDVGLGSPRAESSRGNDRSPERLQGKSLVSDLFGSSKSPAKTEVKKTGEFVLDKKYVKTEKIKDTTDEDDLGFGSYTPSAVTSRPSSKRSAGSRPGSAKSVRFEDDADVFTERPSSVGTSRRQVASSSFLEDMIKNDDRDWLNMATNEPISSSKATKPSQPASEEIRPKSDGPVSEKSKKTENQGTDQSGASVDWLGLSRLGSPEVTPREPSFLDADPTLSAPNGNQAKDSTGPGSVPTKFEHSGQKSSEMDHNVTDISYQEPTIIAGSVMDESDILSVPREKKNFDFLGLGDEVDPDDLISRTSPFKKPASKNMDDLFSTPTRKTTTELPWNVDAHEPKFGRRNTPTLPVVDKDEDTGLAHRTRPTSLSIKDPSPTDGHGRRNIFSDSTPHGGAFRTSGADQQETAAPPQTDFKYSLLQPQPLPATQPVTVQPPATQHMKSQPLTPQLPAMTVPAHDNLFHQRQNEMLSIQEKQLKQQYEQQLQQLKQAQQIQAAAQQQAFQRKQELMESPFGLHGDTPDSKVYKMEMEVKHMQMVLQTSKEQHQEEIRIQEEGYKKRIQLLEESSARREERLKEENELISKQNLRKMQLLEDDKSEFMLSYLKKQGQWEKEQQTEIQRLKLQHRADMDSMKRDHEETLQSLLRAKTQEVDAIAESQTHSRHLQAVIDRIEGNAKGLDELHQRVETQQASSVDDRERAVRLMDEHLKGLQEKLARQQHETEKERARLQGLVTKLELQLTDQARETEQEKWKLKQQESRVQTLQNTLEQEKAQIMEQAKRDRHELDKAKDQLLAEQKEALSKLHEERRALAEERAQLNVSQKLRDEQQHRYVKTEVELDSTIKAINMEKNHLAEKEQRLQREQEQLESERLAIKQEKRNIELEKQKLEQLALDVKRRTQDIDDVCRSAARAKEEGHNALAAAQALQVNQDQKLEKIHLDLQALRETERQIARERLGLARERNKLEDSQNTQLCVSCRTPVRDSSQVIHTHGHGVLPTPPSTMQSISAAIEADRSVRLWRISAAKDKAFLDGENLFMDALKSSPYHSPQATS